jgi:predicted AAA+ superfamily ATPase
VYVERLLDLPVLLAKKSYFLLGLLPSIYFSDDPRADLQAYTGLYLQEEVVAEGAARNVPAFSRFLRVAALCNGTIVNFTKVASDAQVARTTIHEYFEVLKDTLILQELPAWRKSRKRKPLASSKYCFFDVGGRDIKPLLALAEEGKLRRYSVREPRTSSAPDWSGNGAAVARVPAGPLGW